MRSCIFVFVHHVVYVACAPGERKMMASSQIYVHMLHKVLSHGTIVFRSRSIWIAWQPHQKYGLSVEGSSPREVPNPSALPCDDRMSV
jgi:hypothetical protein